MAALLKPLVRILNNGPYLISGGVPLSRYSIQFDSQGFSCGWKETERYPLQASYALCRCGHSSNKPFCDGSHRSFSFDGTETDRKAPYLDRSKMIRGRFLDLSDARELCAAARFCDRFSGIWRLMKQSDDPNVIEIIKEQVKNCPSGRLALWDKEGNQIEAAYQPAIVIVEDPQENMDGPIWVQGGIPIQSADGSIYEARNRMALCRCGKSQNKPFCDAVIVRLPNNYINSNFIE